MSSGKVLAGQAWPWLPGRPLLLLVYLRWLLGRSLVSAGQPKVRRTTVETADVSRCAINDESHDTVPIEVDVEPRVSRVGLSLEVYLGYIYPPTDLGITRLESSELSTLLQGASTLRPTMEVEPEGIGVWHSLVGFFNPSTESSTMSSILVTSCRCPTNFNSTWKHRAGGPMSDDAQDEPQPMTHWLRPRTGTDKGSIQRRGSHQRRMVNRSQLVLRLVLQFLFDLRVQNIMRDCHRILWATIVKTGTTWAGG